MLLSSGPPSLPVLPFCLDLLFLFTLSPEILFDSLDLKLPTLPRLLTDRLFVGITISSVAGISRLRVDSRFFSLPVKVSVTAIDLSTIDPKLPKDPLLLGVLALLTFFSATSPGLFVSICSLPSVE